MMVPTVSGKAKPGSSSTLSEGVTSISDSVLKAEGASLKFGIPCLKFSKRKKIREAFTGVTVWLTLRSCHRL